MRGTPACLHTADRSEVAELHVALNDPTDGTATVEAARGLMERVVLHPAPAGGGLEFDLVGEIAAMLGLGFGRPEGRCGVHGRDLFLRSVTVVAGMRDHLELLLTG